MSESETQLEHEKRTAHKLMHQLDADAVVLMTWRAGSPSVLVSSVLSSAVAHAKVRALQVMADALREAAQHLLEMAEDNSGVKH